MSRVGEGAWVRAAAPLAQDLPADLDARRTEIARRAEAGNTNPRFAVRLVQAYEFAARYATNIDTVRASHKTVELLLQLERISPEEAMKVCGAVLSGKMTRQALDEWITDVKSKTAHHVKILNTIPEIIVECRSKLGSYDNFEWVMPSEDYALIGVDAHYDDFRGIEDEKGRYDLIHQPTYAIVISPLSPCSQLNGLDRKHFLRAALAAGSLFPMVSLYCTSKEEEDWMRRMIRRSVKPTKPQTEYFFCSPT